MRKISNYLDAVNYFNNSRILCNNITEIDSTFWDNSRFSFEREDGELIDIYQYYLTDCTDSDVEYLEQRFNLLFSYSELLGVYVLCVDHYGTAWSHVFVTDNEFTEE